MKKKFSCEKIVGILGPSDMVGGGSQQRRSFFFSFGFVGTVPTDGNRIQSKRFCGVHHIVLLWQAEGHSETAQDAETIRTDKQTDGRTDTRDDSIQYIYVHPGLGRKHMFSLATTQCFFRFVLEQTKRTYAGLHDVQMWCSLLLLLHI